MRRISTLLVFSCVLGLAGSAFASAWLADIATDLTASKGSGTVTYTVVVSNTHDDTARDVRMSFHITPALSISSITAGGSWSCASALEGSERSVVCYKDTSGNRVNMEPSGSLTVTIVASNPTNGATSGEAQAISITPDSITSNNYDTASTL